jgi:UDP-N-acetylmuramoyl-L-alanyl-D-glutamate--2,6-diaminopimelate ligase
MTTPAAGRAVLARPILHRLAQLRPLTRRVCVTGTNGKTTTVAMLDAIVAASGEPSARVDTMGAWLQGMLFAPDPPTAEQCVEAMERAVKAGGQTILYETPSRALLSRIACRWPPTVAVLTNVTREHLRLHGTFDNYLAVKAELFIHLPPGGTAVLNARDTASAIIDNVVPPDVERAGYVLGRPAAECESLPLTLAATAATVNREGTLVELVDGELASGLGGRLRLRLVGEVHAENALAAAVAAHVLGYEPDVIQSALEAFGGVPGRFEIVLDEPLVAVDSANSPDALEKLLQTARELASASASVICVFGCGGEPSDNGMRPLMGAIAHQLADVAVLTTDNPRQEDPEAIADAVAAGASGAENGRARWLRIPDRAEAIRAALELAEPDDVVVIAGKGHERFQVLAERSVPFSDVDAARKAWEEVSAAEQLY